MNLPLQDIRVLEFTHAVMGPSAGLILADMGAEVIHIEPVEGDSTRLLKGFGQGFFSYFGYSKKSLALGRFDVDGETFLAITEIRKVSPSTSNLPRAKKSSTN